MAEIEAYLKNFNNNLNIPESKKRKLIASRKYLKKIIRKEFNNNNYEISSLFTQGSFKTGTMIRTKDDSCDLDLGIKLKSKPHVVTKTIFSNLKSILDNVTDSNTNIKNKCVRVNYSSGYHIDLPVYYKSNNSTYICVKETDDELSDMKKFVNYFDNYSNAKIIRQIRYLKAICNNIDRKMPSGIAITVLVIENYEDSKSDELLNFIDTVTNLINSLKSNNFKCKYPVEPFDDLLSNLTEEQKHKSLSEFKTVLKALEEIRDNNDLESALEKAKSLFGKWFDVDLTKNLGVLGEKVQTINSELAKTNKLGQINSVVGVKNKKHSFYGK